VREYVLTDREKEAIKEFLKTRTPNDLIYVLRHRAKEALPKLKEDLALLEELIGPA
jgi:hypothetical protein